MAILSQGQINKILSKSSLNGNLSIAINHEKRIRMHTQPIFSKSEETTAHRDWFAWAKSFLDKDKYKTFEKLVTYPLPTNEICETIFQEFPRVLQARNKYIGFNFVNQELEQEFKSYLDSINFDDFWTGAAMQALKNQINSIIICDLPSQVGTDRPKPYFYLLPIESVCDIEFSDKIEWVCFMQDTTSQERELGIDSKKAIFDGESFQVYTQKGGIWSLQSKQIHGLGYCPACKFYPKLISNTNQLNSLSPISNALGDLDRWLFWNTSIEHFKLYGAFPIYWGYKQKCNYIDPETKGQCNNEGTIIWYEIQEGTTNQEIHTKPCPKCANKNLMGAGTFIEVTPPEMREDADLRDPVGKLDVQVEALKALEDKNREQESKIIYNCTGKTFDSVTATEAVNEVQVQSSFETRQTILSDIARSFEKTMWFILDTVARLRYDSYYLGCTVELGNSFFLKTVEELNKDYSDAKTAGRPQFELEQKRDFIFVTDNQGNPDIIQRYEVLKNIEPYQGLTIQEMKNLGFDVSDPIGFIIKANFSEFVNRFERENLGVVEFGRNITFQRKIELINQIFKNYANEKNSSKQVERVSN